nr:probable alpha-amylase 2 [Ipomoea batatas]
MTFTSCLQPVVFYDHFYDFGIRDIITELIEARRRGGIHCRSPVKILHANNDGYMLPRWRRRCGVEGVSGSLLRVVQAAARRRPKEEKGEEGWGGGKRQEGSERSENEADAKGRKKAMKKEEQGTRRRLHYDLICLPKPAFFSEILEISANNLEYCACVIVRVADTLPPLSRITSALPSQHSSPKNLR